MKIIKAAEIEAAPLYNEAEVRFFVIDPIIRQLGYPGDETVFLSLEQKLEYPYVHIGRRSKRDVPVGFPDYRAGLLGARGSFVVEAKAGDAAIGKLEVEQAHSYAAHAQVGANYFVLCNGKELRVYETLSGPIAPALVTIPLSEINDRFHELENILSPKSLASNCKVEYDRKLRLCEGLGSSVRIRSGKYGVSDYKYRMLVNGEDKTDLLRATLPQVAWMDQQLELLTTAFELKVADGKVERGEDGRIAASIEFDGATVHNSAAMKLMGIDRASFVTADEFVSQNADAPTMFDGLTEFAVAQGALIPQMFGGAAQVDGDVFGTMAIRAAMYVNEKQIIGQYISNCEMRMKLNENFEFVVEMDIAGLFNLYLD